MDYCIYHSDKTTFENFRRQLQRWKLLPRNLSPRLAMAVCTCKRRAGSKSLTDGEFVKLKQNVKQYMDNWNEVENCSPSCSRWLRRLFSSSDSPAAPSMKTLMYILDSAVRGDFSLLEEERKANTKILRHVKDEDPKTEGDGKIKTLTSRQISLMLRKRKRKLKVKTTLEIPVHGSLLSRFKSEVEEEITMMSKKLKCILEIDWTKTDTQNPVSTLKIWCPSLETVEEIKRRLYEFFRRGRYVSFAKQMELDSKINGISVFQYFYDEANNQYGLNDHFTEKVLSRKKHNCRQGSISRKSHISRNFHNMLCQRCQHSFMEVTSTNISCYFHPGKVRMDDNGQKTWTCCERDAGDRPIKEDHFNTGCMMGSHLWNVSSLTESVSGSRETIRPGHKQKWTVVGYAKAF